MASLISPGIILRERDVTTATIVGAQALTAAFSTTFAKGEVGIITEVDSQRDLLDKFGLPVEGNAEDWLVASEFLNYGGRLAVVRADTAGIRTASTSEAQVDPEYKINTQADFVGQTINELFLARTPGKWGNSAQVIVADRGADVYVEFASAPVDASQNPLAAGDRVTFSNGAAGYVLSYDATEFKAAIVLDEGSAEPTTTDFLQDDNLDPIASIAFTADTEAARLPGTYLGLTADGDTRLNKATFDVVVATDTNGEIATFTDDAAIEPVRDVGVFAPPADANGALFQVTVAAADNLTVGQAVSNAVGSAVVAGAGVTYSGVLSNTDATFDVVRAAVTGAIVSVTPVNGGTGISSGDTIVIAGTQVGGASPADDITITVDDVDLDGGAVTVDLLNGGTGYVLPSTIVLLGAQTGNGTDITVTVDTLVEFGGAVTVTLNAAGDEYFDNETLTLLAAQFGGGVGDATITVTTTESDTAISAVYDWWTNTEISIGSAGNKLKLNALGVRPGTSGFASARGLLYDEVSVAVVDTDGRISGTVNNVVQTFTSLSKLSDGRSAENGAVYYKDILNDESQYIYAGASDVATVINDSVDSDYVDWGSDSVALQDAIAAGGTANKFAVLGVYTKQLTRGADDYDYTQGEITAAYDVFASADQTDLDFILMGGSMSSETDTLAKAAKVVSIAESRKDCIAFVSPHRGNQIGSGGVSLTAAAQKANTINFFRQLPSSSFAVFDSGYKQLYDRFNDRYRYVPCNGDVAGLCVSTSQVLYDWYSPAGVARGALRNAIKLAYTPTQTDRDDLYTNRINPITVLPGTGVTLFGDKTALASTSAFDRINVRRLFLNIEKRVERLASGVLFEQNDVLTRSSFASAVNSYLAEVQAKRGVTDFLVVCDETNNTPDVIDRNEFVAEIFVKAARSINFVSITFTATKTGVAFSEVVGR